MYRAVLVVPALKHDDEVLLSHSLTHYYKMKIYQNSSSYLGYTLIHFVCKWL